MQVGVAEAAVHLYRQRIAARLVRLERGDDLLPHAVETAAVGGDRLQGDEALFACVSDVLEWMGLDPQHRTRRNADPVGELVPGRPDVGRREAVVEEEVLRVRLREQPARVLTRLGREPVREDGLLGRLDTEQLRKFPDPSAVRDAGGDVGPLPRIRALAEEAPKLVERRLRPQDPVRVVVDERDLAQYFSKWPCCSNAASPRE